MGLHVGGDVEVTTAFNVPLNNALAAVEPAGNEGAGLWARYFTGWNRLESRAHRFVASACFVLALA